uniref:Uncharacterized protein n=1 Tax=viral metagenome TaxID=1070528 RepID=A0A6C0EF41_9ZZZZ
MACMCEICGWTGENTGWGPTYCSRGCATSDPRAYADEDYEDAILPSRQTCICQVCGWTGEHTTFS